MYSDTGGRITNGRACLICFKQFRSNSKISDDPQKLYEICCKYLHSAIIKEAFGASYPNLILKQEIEPFCEQCFQSAVQLADVAEKLEIFQKNVSELILMFSLGILQRRGETSIINGVGSLNDIENSGNLAAFDISGLPGLKSNNMSQDSVNNYIPPSSFLEVESPSLIIGNSISMQDVNFADPLVVPDFNCDNEEDSNVITFEQIKMENFINEAREEDLHFNDELDEEIIGIQCENSSSTHTNNVVIKNQLQNKVGSEKVPTHMLPIVKLERLQFPGNRHLVKITDGSQSNVINAKGVANYITSKIGSAGFGRQNSITVDPIRQYNTNGTPEIATTSDDMTFKSEVILPTKDDAESLFLDETTEPQNFEKPTNEKINYFIRNFKRAKYQTRDGVLGKTPTAERPFQCQICRCTFKSKAVLHVHILGIHHKFKPFPCSVCGKGFSQKCNLNIHLRNHTGERPYHCLTCPKKFKSNGELKAHVNNVHKKETSKHVYTMNENITSDYSLGKNMTNYSTGKSIDETITWEKIEVNGLENTLSANEGLCPTTVPKPFKCTMCNKIFQHKGNLNVHLRWHTGEKPFQCVECGNRFTTKGAMKFHCKSKHNTGDSQREEKIQTLGQTITTQNKFNRYKCCFCARRFSQSGHLKRHLLTHPNDQKFKCPACPKLFVSHRNMRIHHSWSHKNETKHLTTDSNEHEGEGDERTVSTSQVPNPEIEKPFKCHLCAERFVFKSSLDNHMDNHYDIRPYQCAKCDYETTNNASLKSHMVYKHSTLRKFKCNECGKDFKTVYCVKQHYKNVHSEITFTTDCAVPKKGIAKKHTTAMPVTTVLTESDTIIT